MTVNDPRAQPGSIPDESGAEDGEQITGVLVYRLRPCTGCDATGVYFIGEAQSCRCGRCQGTGRELKLEQVRVGELNALLTGAKDARQQRPSESP